MKRAEGYRKAFPILLDRYPTEIDSQVQRPTAICRTTANLSVFGVLCLVASVVVVIVVVVRLVAAGGAIGPSLVVIRMKVALMRCSSLVLKWQQGTARNA